MRESLGEFDQAHPQYPCIQTAVFPPPLPIKLIMSSTLNYIPKGARDSQPASPYLHSWQRF